MITDSTSSCSGFWDVEYSRLGGLVKGSDASSGNGLRSDDAWVCARASRGWTRCLRLCMTCLASLQKSAVVTDRLRPKAAPPAGASGDDVASISDGSTTRIPPFLAWLGGSASFPAFLAKRLDDLWDSK